MISKIFILFLTICFTATATTVNFPKHKQNEINFSTYISDFFSNQLNKMLIFSTISKFLGIQSTFKASNTISIQPHTIHKRDTEILNITSKLTHMLGYNKIVNFYINNKKQYLQFNVMHACFVLTLQ